MFTTQSDPMYEQYTVFPVQSSRTNISATKLYQQVKVHANPIAWFEKKLDMLCFPDIFPTGVNGQHEIRLQSIRDCDYNKARILSRHPRYRRNMQYIFHLMNNATMRQINGGVYQTLNLTNANQKFTKESYLQKVAIGDFDQGENKMNNVFNRVRNTKEYWKKPMCDLNAMIKEYGPATWFVTFSPGE